VVALRIDGEQRVCSGRCFVSGRFFDSVPHVIPAQCSVVFSLTLSPTARILFLLWFPAVAPVSIFRAHKQVWRRVKVSFSLRLRVGLLLELLDQRA
jgi:hypothetical protein